MKILLDNTSFLPIVGGTETYIYQLLTSFHPERLDARLICQVPETGPSEINGFPIIRVGDLGVKSGYHPDSLEDDLALGMGCILRNKGEAAQSFRKIREAGLERYYVHLDGFVPNIVLVNDLMRVIGAPYLQHVLHAYGSKLIVNLHGILTSFGSFWASRPNRKRLAQELVAREDLSIFFIAPSKYVYGKALDWGIREERLELIYLGIDTDFFSPSTPQEKADAKKEISNKFVREDIMNKDTILIGFPSRAVSHKGVDTALEALRILAKSAPDSDWRLLIAGGASDNPESISDVQKLIERFDVQKRILVGTDMFVDFPRDIGLFYQACDVCLFPSRREALGYGALESMSRGVPVIGTSIQGLSEALGIIPDDSGECPGGWAVAPEDSGALAAQLGAVLAEPTVLKRKGNEARRWVEKNFKLERMVSEHLNFFEKIIADS